MKTTVKNRGVQIFSVAAALVGTVVGAGFASGREILQFFGQFGVFGNWGIIIAVLLMGATVQKVFRFAVKLNSDSYQDLFRYLLGVKSFFLVDFGFFCLLEILVGVMFAGCGSVFEMVNWGYWPGVALTAFICIMALRNELSGLIAANLVIIPSMFLATMVVSAFSISRGTTEVEPIVIGFGWTCAALEFAAYNLVLALPVLIALANRYRGEARVLSWGGWLGVLGLGVMSAGISGAMVANFSRVKDEALPMAELANILGKPAFFGYILIIWAEMFSTVLANLFGLGKRLEGLTGGSFQLSILMLTAVGIAISKISFVELIAKFYPIAGALSLILIVILLIKPAKI